MSDSRADHAAEIVATRSASGYTPYHPRWYRQPVSVWWWLQKWSYARFVLRELTSVSVAFFAVVFLWLLHALGQGPEAYARALDRLSTPLFVLLAVIGLALVLYHTLTWFAVAPAAMVVRVKGKRLPDSVVAGAHFAAWAVTSAIVAWLVLGAGR
jgi:fumarate reductase subunit C